MWQAICPLIKHRHRESHVSHIRGSVNCPCSDLGYPNFAALVETPRRAELNLARAGRATPHVELIRRELLPGSRNTRTSIETHSAIQNVVGLLKYREDGVAIASLC